MHRFEVWAPLPKRVALQLNSMALSMQGPDEQGWWRLEVDEAGAGTDYGYLIDEDKQCYPDPRSQWQPNGVHGMSRVYGQSSFEWTDALFQPHPVESGVIYELHIGTFTPEGTLDAAIGKLDYLVSLGITHVELMPVASFEGIQGWGYDGVALFAVHEPYGGPDALKRFVDEAHRKQLSVLLDVVYNHFGPTGNYTGKFGPYLVDSHRTPWGSAVNLEDAGSDQVRRFFCDNAIMWMRDFRVDGLRLDAVHAFIDRSAIHFLEQLSAEVESLGASVARRLTLIAESDLNDPRVVAPRDEGGLGMDAQWSDDFHHALFAVLCREPAAGYYTDFGELSQLAKALEYTFVYDGIYSKFRNRNHGRAANRVSQRRFLGYIQNHDQVGNRALGDRLTEAAGFDRAKIAAAVVLMSPFIPLLFQGEEWAASTPFQYFADHGDKELRRLVSEGRKREFAAFGYDPESIPDPENHETIKRSKLNWGEVHEREHQEMLDWYRELIRLRRSLFSSNDSNPAHTRISYSEDEKWLSMERSDISVNLNLGGAGHQFQVPEGAQILLGSRGGMSVQGGTVSLAPYTVVITGNGGAREDCLRAPYRV